MNAKDVTSILSWVGLGVSFVAGVINTVTERRWIVEEVAKQVKNLK